MDTLRVSQLVGLSPSAIFITLFFTSVAHLLFKLFQSLSLRKPKPSSFFWRAARASRLRTAFTHACSRLCSHGLNSKSKTAERGDVAALAKSHMSGSLRLESTINQTTETKPLTTPARPPPLRKKLINYLN